MLTLAVSAASSVAGFAQQSQQADQQHQLYEENRRNAIQAFQDKQVATNNRMVQEQEAAAGTKFDASLKANAAKATAITAAGESGVSGLSIEGLLGDFSARTDRFNDRVDNNLDWTLAQLQSEKKGQAATTANQINSVRDADKPSFLDAGLRIAGAGLNSYASAQKNIKAGASPLW